MFKNPQYNSLKVMLLVVVLAGAGYFAFNHQNNNSNQGLVINQQAPQQQQSPQPPTPNWFYSTINSTYGNHTTSSPVSHYIIAKYTITNAASEPVRLTNLKLGATMVGVNATNFTNVTFYNPGANANYAAPFNPSVFPYNETMPNIVFGSHETKQVFVYADIAANVSGSITTNLTPTGVGQNSNTLFTPPSATTGQTITINQNTSGLLVVSSNPSYGNQLVDPNTPHFKIASFVLQNSATVPVNITSFQITSAGSVSLSNFTNVSTYIGSTQFGGFVGTLLATNYVVGSYIIGANQQKIVNVYADVGSATSGNVRLGITANGEDSNAIAYQSNILSNSAGQLITISYCTLTETLDSSTSPAQNVAIGTHHFNFLTVKYSASGCDAQINSFNVGINTGLMLPGDLSNLEVDSGSQVIYSNQTTTYHSNILYLMSGNLIVPNNSSKLVTIYADLNSGVNNLTAAFGINNTQWTNGQSAVMSTIATGVVGNTMTVIP